MPNLNACYSWAVQKCREPNIGYSQAYRNQQTVNGITYYDCSSFINYALLAGGFSTPGYAPDANAFTTYTMDSVLTQLGWRMVDASGIILPGDIGVSDSHTEMCYQQGTGSAIFMGAHTDGVPLDDQVSIANYTSSFPRIFRYGDTPASGGYSIYVISAMCGNFWQESGINPGIWEGLLESAWTSLNRGFGLGQWTNTGGDTHGRLYQLHEWLSSNGYEDDSGDGQVQYLIHENVWYSVDEASGFADLTAFLTSDSTDLTMLTHAFNRGWEGIHDGTWDARVGYANDCYDYITANYNNPNITEWITGNRFLSTSERLNNAVMLYRLLSGGIQPEPGRRSKSNMPVYMMIKRYI